MKKGFFFLTENGRFTLNNKEPNFPSHPDRLKTPGVDMTTGSLGQGTSAAAGIATGDRWMENKMKLVNAGKHFNILRIIN